MKALTKTLGAWPFFAAVFLNAFVDLGHKITVQNTIFKLYSEQTQIISTAVLNALILLPFILLLSPAGFISDRFARAKIMRITAWIAVGLCGLIWLSYLNGWFWLAFGATFLLAAQSAIYSPAKFSYIKELFGQHRLAEANGVVASLSIIAILAGTFAFSISFESLFVDAPASEAEVLQAVAPIGILLIITSIVELVLMYRLPMKPEYQQPVASNQSFQWSSFFAGKLFVRDLAPLREQKAVRLSIIGLATFWGIGQVMLAAFPAYFKGVAHIDNTIIIQGILACSGIGIALGAFLAGRISRDRIELGILPFAALGIAVGLLFLPSLDSPQMAALDFFAIGVCGGLFIVPLNSLIQFQAKEGALGKTLAANNWVQNVTMFSFLALTVGFALLDISGRSLLYVIACVAVIGFAYTLYQLPQSFLRILVMTLMRNRYRVQVQGLNNLPSQGGALLLGNHISWIDWAIIQMACPRPVRFVMHRQIYQLWYLKWFFDLAGCIPIEAGTKSRRALETVREYLEAGELVCLFPEGTLSRTGHLVEFRKGFERACEGLSESVPIVPFYLHGLWGSQFSRSTTLLKKQKAGGVRRKIVVALGKPIANNSPSETVKQCIFDLSIQSWQEDVNDSESLGRKWVVAAKQQGGSFCMADSLGTHLSAQKALIATTALSFSLKRKITGQHIGVLLPSTAAGALTNMALFQLGRTVVNLNYTIGENALSAAIRKADISTIVTSRKFIQKLKNKGFNLENVLNKVDIVELESVKDAMPLTTKIRSYLLCKLLPTPLLKTLITKSVDIDQTACILFSSGSEGEPKGICLSHKNIQANIQQTLHVLNPEQDDIMLGNLPLFHAFGLTATLFLPLLNGIPAVFHGDPTDVVGTAKLVARYKATLMFGTSTFFRLYVKNRNVHPLMLDSLRLVVSGAEKLNAQVQKNFFEKFSKPIYEGYGATEATPVVSVNLPDQLDVQSFKVHQGSRPGSVGMPLPGTSMRIVDPETFEPLPTGEAGMILIGGVQIMQGYLKDTERTHSVLLQMDGQRWYITGDKGKVDEDGFLFILDRYSRFAKIGGEMISMGKTEQIIYELYAESRPAEQSDDELEIALVSIEDEKRGEKLILLTNKTIDKLVITQNFIAKGLSNLALPTDILLVEDVPKLSTGKIDFISARKIAKETLQR
ncbi:acyl-[ACP]--phospholipid O-acyltransferase [Teredinibacter haidensis]|uniref:acyl-[ACP]--phospholipid O-acyltransferase n=1 Tax=Teredinibacter haidensis TaxID=2731755 RepID=UPI000948A9E8|nr:acyl-[ACP]--phospholipid O-acyltransferase [Teredinibacter haidensis]